MPGKTDESRRKLHRSCVRRPLGGKARQRQAMCAHGKPLPCVCAVGDTFLAPAAFGRLSRIENARGAVSGARSAARHGRDRRCAHTENRCLACAPSGTPSLLLRLLGGFREPKTPGELCQAPARRQGAAETSDVRTRKTVALRARRGAGARGACRQPCRHPRAPFPGARLCRRRDRPCRMPVFAPNETAVML